jgi:hypothetical protein
MNCKTSSIKWRKEERWFELRPNGRLIYPSVKANKKYLELQQF